MRFARLLVAVIVCIILTSHSVFSKEIKPRVLVYGDNMEALAAAIQSAHSGVPTLWVLPSSACCTALFSSPNRSPAEDKLAGSIWMNVFQKIGKKNGGNDSLFNVLKQELSPQGLQDILEKLILEQKNLTVLKNVNVVKIVNKQKMIDVVLSNKQKVSIYAVVDASSTLDLLQLLRPVDALSATKKSSAELISVYTPVKDLGSDILRTLVAVGEVKGQDYGLTLAGALSSNLDNLFFLSSLSNPGLDLNNIPFQFNIGQALGACAAYCAFFKTKADKIDVRNVQSELISFDSRLLPFADINSNDPNFEALQNIFLVNILPFDRMEKPLQFYSLDSVSISSVRNVMQQLYSRSPLWFVDANAEYFTTNDLVELLKVISFRGDELDIEIKKGWNKRFNLKGTFDLGHTITRYEFAVLLNAYGQPFTKKVNLVGVIQR